MTDTALKLGDHVPDLSLNLADGRVLSSADLAGRPYLLYFYPKADTPGCTTQACSIRDHKASLASLGLTVIGVSPDPIAKIQKFEAKYALDFPLASDEDHSIAEVFGTWVEKSMYGRKYMGMERSSFLVDSAGVIRFIWRNVKPAEHVQLVTEAMAQLG
ncbi:thioredoxin-dependent thiol peroxidase [Neokomagataea tanensis]|uniref:thioredoxin-dependent peroxiredoxin n=2 Tax=Neokomagataea TaxID=1223423 RepID=A0A4Y6VA32_9PROT|nr:MULTISPECIES: thioredoxin-dependent thiol peroxidase [Neokomagataea]QDH25788.1 thioredoxin-dependent thiol peroxidase [Neokomagataea tanensis]